VKRRRGKKDKEWGEGEGGRMFRLYAPSVSIFDCREIVDRKTHNCHKH
jgi:hypothetical protein